MSGELGRYLLVRGVRGLATVLGVVTLVFLLVRLIPGDPVDTLLGDRATAEDRADLRARLLKAAAASDTVQISIEMSIV